MTTTLKKLSVALLALSLLATSGVQLYRDPIDIVEVVSIEPDQY